MPIVEVESTPLVSKEEIRERILSVQEQMAQVPGAMFGDCLPLTHVFVDGAYVREMFMPKDTLLVSKIHKITHPFFVMKGDISILSQDGVIRIKAPFSGVTVAGTKRVIYSHEDSILVTVHVTKETDLDKIENEIITPEADEMVDEITLNKFITEARKE